MPAAGARRFACSRTGTQDPGLAPQAHGALRVEVLGGAEGAGRFRVVEPPGEAITLVEIGARILALGPDRGPREPAEIVEERRLHLAPGRGRPLRKIATVGSEFGPCRRLGVGLMLSLRDFRPRRLHMLARMGQAMEKPHPRTVVIAQWTG